MMKAAFLTCVILVYPIESAKVQLSMDVISGLIDTYVKPYLNTLNSVSTEIKFRSKPNKRVDKNDIIKIIKDKVSELKDVLQDDQYAIPAKEDDLTLEGEETTIIEFLPDTKKRQKEELRSLNDKQRELKSHMMKYKRMRRKVNKALVKESVSKDTKVIVTKAIDDMMAKIVEHQCTWNNVRPGLIIRGRKSKSEPMELAKSWSILWQKLYDQYIKKAKDNGQTRLLREDKKKFLKDFYTYIHHVFQDMQSLSQNYKVICTMVNKAGEAVGERYTFNSSDLLTFQTKKYEDDGDHTVIRNGKNDMNSNIINREKLGGDDEGSCANFKLCSEELIDFMTDFYKTLNDTAVSTLRNYAAMFTKDVSPDGKYETSDVVTLIYQIADEAEENVRKAFLKQVRKLTLNNNKNANIKALNKLVQKTILHTKNHMKNSSDEYLKFLGSDVLDTIKKDVYVNLDMDLENLEREIRGRICTVFQICNGRYIVDRRFGDMPYIPNKNEIYVKVQLKLDDEVKEELSKQIRYRSLMGYNKTIDVSDQDSKRFVTKSSPLVSVTRTTIKNKEQYKNINLYDFVKNLNVNDAVNKPDLGKNTVETTIEPKNQQSASYKAVNPRKITMKEVLEVTEDYEGTFW